MRIDSGQFMREIVLDTETTGFDPLSGDRVVEIGCLELVNQVPTGETYHTYLNPERPMPEAAFRIHGLSDEFLKDKPRFVEVADRFLAFLGDSPLIIHNAEFDMRFINYELDQIGAAFIPMERAIDTVRIARQKYPGAPASLDALCKRFNIDNSARDLHGALLDAQLLAEVYLQLLGGRQTGLELEADLGIGSALIPTSGIAARPVRPAREFEIPIEELEAHRAFVAKLKDPLWLR